MKQAGCKALIVAHAFIAHPFVVLPELRQVWLELTKLAANVAKLAILAVSLAALFRQHQLGVILAALLWQRYYDDTNLTSVQRRQVDSTKDNQRASGISRKNKNREARAHFSDFENETKPLRKARLPKSGVPCTYSSSFKAAAISSVIFMVL